ncbi:VOC family protein [Vallitalea okinawensis]|uniref:VOC family protein n=1 Tax=Vallitalea okinawensis TaxID=2078660 RepID=UPI001300B10D|nr:VOC family protein [Vallitalea okinawensis]
MISPTIHFPGNCNEAIAFYEKVFNVTHKKVEFYRDAPSNSGFTLTDDMKDLVMHSSMTICGTPFNFSDTQEKTIAGNMICFNVFFQTVDEVCNAFNKLEEDGNVIVELGPQFFSDMYGSVVDKFGIKWQLISE